MATQNYVDSGFFAYQSAFFFFITLVLRWFFLWVQKLNL
jgi:hypothetical protein